MKMETLKNSAKLAKVLVRRGFTVRINRMVWVPGMEAFVSAANVYKAGIGLAHRTKEEQGIYDLVLLETAKKKAEKALKIRNQSRRLDWDRERLLDLVIQEQERLAVGLKKIQEAKEKRTACSLRLQAARDGAYLPEEKWQATLQARDAWKERETVLWDVWKSIKDNVSKLAKEFKLWPMFFQVKNLSFGRYVWDVRPPVKDESLEWNEKPNGLTGHFYYDQAEDLAWSHVVENQTLMSGYAQCDRMKKWRPFHGATKSEVKRSIAWAARRRFEQRVKSL